MNYLIGSNKKGTMNIQSPERFRSKFLEASSLEEAGNHRLVQELNLAKDSLQQDFEREFGDDAFRLHYLGYIKEPVHTADYNYDYDDSKNRVYVTADPPKPKKQNIKISFPHGAISNKFGINFGSLHITKAKPLFMAMAMHQLTHNPTYDELASYLCDELEVAINENLHEGYPLLTQLELDIIIDELSDAVNRAVECRKPDSLRAADTIDPMSEDENPGPKPGLVA